MAAELDRDPLKLFELRGLPREDLLEELAKTPLGVALSKELTSDPAPSEPVESLHTIPTVSAVENEISLTDFWQGEKRLPNLNAATEASSQSTNVPAILLKKQGDYPPFWDRNNSFIEVMEEFYTRIRTKNKNILE